MRQSLSQGKSISQLLTSTVGKIGLGAKGSAASVTGAEVREAVVAADWLDVRHAALATEVAGGSEINLKGLGSLAAAVEIWYCRPSHLDVIAAQEEQHAVAREADDV